jgi:CheY-like chemotaxis protein
MRRVFVSHAALPPKQKTAVFSDFDGVLFWARLAAAQSRKSPERIAREADALKALHQDEGYLAEFLHWRESTVFSVRERAAMELSEAISRGEAKANVAQIREKTKGLFTESELIRLNLSIHAINEWYDTHVRCETYVLIVQAEIPDQAAVRQEVNAVGGDSTPIIVRSTREALRVLTDRRRPVFRSQLAAVVVDIRLPEISAAELLPKIRQIPGRENLPVVVITSSVRPEDTEEYEQLKFEAAGETAVEMASISDALRHIGGRDVEVEAAVAEEIPAPTGLLQVYERLREHFAGKGERG